MSWNYRIIKNKKDGFFGIHEVYYDDKGRAIVGYTEALFVGENKKEIISDLEMMLRDCKRSRILDESTMKIKKDYFKRLASE